MTKIFLIRKMNYLSFLNFVLTLKYEILWVSLSARLFHSFSTYVGSGDIHVHNFMNADGGRVVFNGTATKRENEVKQRVNNCMDESFVCFCVRK